MLERKIVNVYSKGNSRILLKTSIEKVCRRHFSFSKTLLLVALFFFCTFDFVEAASISGSITEGGKPLPDAEIVFSTEGKDFSTRTNDKGGYQIFLEPGIYKMRIIKNKNPLGTFWVRSARHNVTKTINIE